MQRVSPVDAHPFERHELAVLVDQHLRSFVKCRSVRHGPPIHFVAVRVKMSSIAVEGVRDLVAEWVRRVDEGIIEVLVPHSRCLRGAWHVHLIVAVVVIGAAADGRVQIQGGRINRGIQSLDSLVVEPFGCAAHVQDIDVPLQTHRAEIDRTLGHSDGDLQARELQKSRAFRGVAHPIHTFDPRSECLADRLSDGSIAPSRPLGQILLFEQLDERQTEPVLLLPHHAPPARTWLELPGNGALEREELAVGPIIQKWRVQPDQPKLQIGLPILERGCASLSIQRLEKSRMTDVHQRDLVDTKAVKVTRPVDLRRDLAQLRQPDSARFVACCEGFGESRLEIVDRVDAGAGPRPIAVEAHEGLQEVLAQRISYFHALRIGSRVSRWTDGNAALGEAVDPAATVGFVLLHPRRKEHALLAKEPIDEHRSPM